MSSPDVNSLRDAALVALVDAKTAADLDAVEIAYLGRKGGALSNVLRDLGAVPAEERKAIGLAANAAKQEIEAALARRRTELESVSLAGLADTERIDVTAPGTGSARGHLHMTTQAIQEITAIFSRLGYNRMRYPEVEWDWYAFESLNMPKEHPARDEWETFFLLDRAGTGVRTDTKLGKLVLTPHTSSGQVREMQRVVAEQKGKKDPDLRIRMINISKCYRRQSDVTHVPMFHQFEGLLIDRDVSITHLKGTLDHFASAFFGSGRRTRLRPYHFRFTEPSFEVDISCGVCDGTGQVEGQRCRVCKEGWLELGGAGMVHPNVLRAGGIDPEKWGGFAFGWGVERTSTMKSGTRIDDLRILYKNDARFLEQF